MTRGMEFEDMMPEDATATATSTEPIQLPNKVKKKLFRTWDRVVLPSSRAVVTTAVLPLNNSAPQSVTIIKPNGNTMPMMSFCIPGLEAAIPGMVPPKLTDNKAPKAI
eukprot:CAMPEP_0202349102 /NCGR_PEP_ID=MMETSP1126-20121109/6738_1 /ASSEMBLY_ACC=CAM_ASM_000457 /TAXON_ID=3047 /ORGANISM="Dunaliella tertiolecta, Strain CCMP1320" /LENGTH=107 /DNA_ID=CAMNT_0048940865 /DNA_START=751 /DNA_END=1074 /DNA_ORIENTATION=+